MLLNPCLPQRGRALAVRAIYVNAKYARVRMLLLQHKKSMHYDSELEVAKEEEGIFTGFSRTTSLIASTCFCDCAVTS